MAYLGHVISRDPK